MSIPVVAVIKAKAGKTADLKKALEALLKPTHAEEGCVAYALHQAEKDPQTFVFIEKWTSSQTLDQHLKSTHVMSLMSRAPELVEKADILPLIPLQPDVHPKATF